MLPRAHIENFVCVCNETKEKMDATSKTNWLTVFLGGLFFGVITTISAVIANMWILASVSGVIALILLILWWLPFYKTCRNDLAIFSWLVPGISGGAILFLGREATLLQELGFLITGSLSFVGGCILWCWLIKRDYFGTRRGKIKVATAGAMAAIGGLAFAVGRLFRNLDSQNVKSAFSSLAVVLLTVSLPFAASVGAMVIYWKRRLLKMDRSE